ncbi:MULTISPECIES: DMT family transporter [Halomonadaceae]|uniref:DMT family transporter n=1 Tax=Vreelandella titanicae TaxID=664683 RepID=A0A558JAJ4_9GAMM|nr:MULTISPECIES: DMT family transporter [Halomonas]MBR9904545.1 DMT family transporter [Gammaproteobacteria bacterium]TVU90650.1 DMT family transporter [Halomonas titanicae]CEP37194.1 Drug/metabolite transporter [Halomonas sp. R57-5]
MNSFLYISTVLIWGSTWLAIAWQVGDVAVPVSVFYRFLIAALVLLGGLALFRRRQALQARDHLFCLLQGGCVFGLNFYCFYTAAGYLPSGLIAILFSMSILFNAVNGYLFFRTPVPRVFYLALALGLPGMALIFWQDLVTVEATWELLGAIGLALLGTYGFSLGNMVSVRHQRRGLKINTTNAFAMLYGGVLMGSIAWSQGASFSLPAEPRYLGALVYLAVIGSVGGFGAYFMLVGRIGAGKAAYATVLFPLVALALSTVFEGYQWHADALIGLAMIVSGNLLMFNAHGLVWRWLQPA